MKRHLFSFSIFALLLFGFNACSGGGGSSSSTGPGPGRNVSDLLAKPFLGNKRLLIIVAEFTDQGPLFEKSAAGEAELVAMYQDMIDAYDENSRGALSLEFDYTWPPVLIPKATTDYNPITGFVRVRSDAIAAARLAGYDPDQYDREVLFVPKVWPGAARGWVRTVWMPNKLPWVFFHEIGHTMGWGHANFLDDDPTADVVTANEVDYGDFFDPMGTGRTWDRFHHSGPWFQERVGWLDPGQIQDVTVSGTYNLASLEDAATATDPIALRIRRNSSEDLWMFHRSSEELIKDGVVVVRVRSNPFFGTLLLDMNRGTVGEEASDASLLAGQVFDDTVESEILIRNVTVGGGPIQLEIDVNEVRQGSLDTQPWIQVVSPPSDGGVLSGVVDFDIAVADPNVGATDGDGVSKVHVEILEPSQDPFLTVATIDLFEAPYVWSVDTTTLKDAAYYLSITAEGADGGSRTVWCRFLVENFQEPGGE